MYAFEITEMIEQAKLSNKPSFVIVPSIIGLYTRYSASNEAHSYLVSKEEAYDFRQNMGLDTSMFSVPASMYRDYANCFTKADKMLELYSQTLLKYKSKYKKEYELFEKFLTNDFDVKVDTSQITMHKGTEIGAQVLNIFAEQMPNIIGGSADLANSTKTIISKSGFINSGKFTNRNLRFGVREFAMAAICNGISLHGGLIPFCSTFLTFSDYLKPAIRMSAMMNLPVTYIFTHDSITVGPDGPTHQPIEQMAMIRSIPGMKLYRPADARELLGCWQSILNSNNNPSALILARNEVDLLPGSDHTRAVMGGYVVHAEKTPLKAILIATGTEVQVAKNIAYDYIRAGEYGIRVVSMPCLEGYLERGEKYQENVLPIGVKKIIIEAGSSFGWHRIMNSGDEIISLDQFGYSGTKDEVLHAMNFSYEQILSRVKELLDK